MNHTTPAQQKMVQTWIEQRDTLLRDIGVRSVERDELTKGNIEKGLASADLDRQIAEKKGRLLELDALETRMRGSLPTDIAELEVRKSRLEGECAVKESELQASMETHAIVVVATAELQSANDTMKDQAAIVGKVAGELVQITQAAGSDMKVVMAEVKAVADQVIEKSNENLAQAGIVLDKLPRYIFELQKPIPVRRTYRAAPGTVILPESGTEIKNP